MYSFMILTPLGGGDTKLADQNQSGGHDRLGRAEPLPQGNDDFQTGLSQPHFFAALPLFKMVSQTSLSQL
jgi:hypothetical protein